MGAKGRKGRAFIRLFGTCGWAVFPLKGGSWWSHLEPVEACRILEGLDSGLKWAINKDPTGPLYLPKGLRLQVQGVADGLVPGPAAQRGLVTAVVRWVRSVSRPRGRAHLSQGERPGAGLRFP